MRCIDLFHPPRTPHAVFVPRGFSVETNCMLDSSAAAASLQRLGGARDAPTIGGKLGRKASTTKIAEKHDKMIPGRDLGHWLPSIQGLIDGSFWQSSCKRLKATSLL